MTKKEAFRLTREELAIKLKGAGYQYYPEFGWIKEDRLAKCIKHGLMKDTGDEFMLTREGAIRNTVPYLHGNVNVIQRRTSSDVHRSKIKKEEQSIGEAFNF